MVIPFHTGTTGTLQAPSADIFVGARSSSVYRQRTIAPEPQEPLCGNQFKLLPGLSAPEAVTKTQNLNAAKPQPQTLVPGSRHHKISIVS